MSFYEKIFLKLIIAVVLQFFLFSCLDINLGFALAPSSQVKELEEKGPDLKTVEGLIKAQDAAKAPSSSSQMGATSQDDAALDFFEGLSGGFLFFFVLFVALGIFLIAIPLIFGMGFVYFIVNSPLIFIILGGIVFFGIYKLATKQDRVREDKAGGEVISTWNAFKLNEVFSVVLDVMWITLVLISFFMGFTAGWVILIVLILGIWFLFSHISTLHGITGHERLSSMDSLMYFISHLVGIFVIVLYLPLIIGTSGVAFIGIVFLGTAVGLFIKSQIEKKPASSPTKVPEVKSATALTPFPESQKEFVGPIKGFNAVRIIGALDNKFNALKSPDIDVRFDGKHPSIAQNKWDGIDKKGLASLGANFIKFVYSKFDKIKADNAVISTVQTELLQLACKKNRVGADKSLEDFEVNTLISAWLYTDINKLKDYRLVLGEYRKTIDEPEYQDGMDSYLALLQYVIDNYSDLHKQLKLSDSDIVIEKVLGVLDDIGKDVELEAKFKDQLGNVKQLKVLVNA